MEIDPAVRSNTLSALEVFRSLGAEVTGRALPWSWEVYHAAATHHKTLFGAWLADNLDAREDQLTTYARRFARERYLHHPRLSHRTRCRRPDLVAIRPDDGGL